MTTPNDFVKGDDRIYKQPFFSGRGNHMSDKLHQLCEEYKNFCIYETILYQRIVEKWVELCKYYIVDSHLYQRHYRDLSLPVEPERKSVGSMEDYLEEMEDYRHKVVSNNWVYCRAIDLLNEKYSN